MKTVLHKANSRGFANHGWLRSFHTFSFAGYHDPERMNFGALRVLNDDVVQPKMGFGTHPHQNMEIISIPLKGALSHKDSMGNKRSIEVDEIQVMSAGTGLTHSEFNDSQTSEVNFLQLWILPEKMDIAPRYEQRKFPHEARRNTWQTIVAPMQANDENALPLNQQAYLRRSYLEANETLDLQRTSKDNGFYIFVIDGRLEIADTFLESRDALGVYDTEQVSIKAIDNTELLVIEVPMT